MPFMWHLDVFHVEKRCFSCGKKMPLKQLNSLICVLLNHL